MANKKLLHEVISNPQGDGEFNFETHVQTPFEDLKNHFRNEIIIKPHYTFTQQELISLLRTIDGDDSFNYNAISFFPLIENGQLALYAQVRMWNGIDAPLIEPKEDDPNYPQLPGGGGIGGPPVLKTIKNTIVVPPPQDSDPSHPHP